MKHRKRNSKIKYEHRMLQGLRAFLESELEPLIFVKSIIPGEIRPTKASASSLVVRFKYRTISGAKLLAYGSGAVQEIFVVTSRPEWFKKYKKKGEKE